jgi:hypothetical protein
VNAPSMPYPDFGILAFALYVTGIVVLGSCFCGLICGMFGITQSLGLRIRAAILSVWRRLTHDR